MPTLCERQLKHGALTEPHPCSPTPLTPSHPTQSQQPQRAAELKYGTLTELQKQLKAAEGALAARAGGDRLLKEEVTEADVAEVIARWTGIPVTKLVRAGGPPARTPTPAAAAGTAATPPPPPPPHQSPPPAPHPQNTPRPSLSARSCLPWATSSTSAWWGRRRRSPRSRRPSSAAARACPTPTAPSRASCFWGPRVGGGRPGGPGGRTACPALHASRARAPRALCVRWQ